jgi:hypothetical protein
LKGVQNVIRLVLTIAALLAAFSVSFADGQPYPVGYVNADGYTMTAQGWRYGNSIYTRTWTAPYYSYNGCNRCYTPGFYSYVYYAPYQAPATTVEKDSHALIREKMLEMAKDRLESEYDLKLAKTLGLDFLPTTPKYVPGSSAYMTYGNYSLTGATQYATPYNLLQTPQLQYTAFDINASQAAQYRLIEKLATGVHQGANDLAALQQQALDGNLQVALIGARTIAAAKILERIEAPRATTTTITNGAATTTTSPAGQLLQQLPSAIPQAVDPLDAVWQSSAQQCVACHNPTVKKGGFNVYEFKQLPEARQLEIIEKNLMWGHPSESRHMPRLGSGARGAQLPREEILSWFPRKKV